MVQASEWNGGQGQRAAVDAAEPAERIADRSQESGAMQGTGTHRNREKKPRAEPTPVQRAIGLLSRREHSQKELAAKLAARGVPADDAQATVQRMAADGWQDDQRFAISLARMRMSNGYGPIRIRAEIGTHRLSEEIAAAAMHALDDSGDADWPARARDLVRRRYGEPSTVARDARLRRKAVDFLMRRGFDGDCIRHALSDGADE